MHERRQSGTILVLGLVAAIPLLMLFVALLRMELLGTAAQRGQTAAEAASLAAAADLSKIVVNDPYYGFVALSDYGPYGKDTLAADGEPLPVLGINNIIATVRLQTLLADQLNNDELRRLAQEDVQAARHAAKRLSDALNASLQPGSRYQARDLDGNIVKPLEHAIQIYSTSLNGGAGLRNARVSDFRLTLGWLKSGSDSNTKSPLPENLSTMPAAARMKGNYRAFIDIPACGESFYFAGLSPQPSLANINQFMNADGKRFCSIVKVDADLTGVGYGDSRGADQCLHTSACAQPPSLPDMSAPGVLAISFKHGIVPGIRSIENLLDNDQLKSSKVDILTADGGDFPIDLQSKLVSTSRVDSVKSVSQTFAMGFHDWLRTAHNKPRIDSVIDAVCEPFVQSTHAGSGLTLYPNLFYEIDANGRVRISNLRQSPFFATDPEIGIDHSKQKPQPHLSECIYDQQDYALNFDAITAGAYSWMMVYRNYTRALGTVSGGKHAGQVLPGDPVNWCELTQFDSDPDQAFEKGKGEKALGLQAQGAMYDERAVMLEGAHFTKRNGSPLSNQPRKSYYSGGLAVYFELSSPLEADLNQS